MTRQVRRRAIRTIRRGGSVEVEDLAQAVELLAGMRGHAAHVRILHGPVCSAARCLCSPGFVVELLTAETYLAGRRAQERWLEATAEAEA